MSIVVTAASGHLGRLVLAELLDRGVPADQLVAAGRSPDKLADLAGRGVAVVAIDYTDPGTLAKAFSAGDTVLLISSGDLADRVGQHRNAVEAAAAAGVGRLVYTSVLGADDTPLPIAPDHVRTEAIVRESGLPFTFLRNGWYTENYGRSLDQVRGSGVLLTSVGDGRVASATRADFAAATAAVLTGGGHEGKAYELSGDEAWTFDDLAAAFSTLLGREVAHRSVSPEEHRRILVGNGVDPQLVGFLVAMDGAIREGALAVRTGDLSRLAGRPTTPLLEGLRPLAG
ncbi:SDR family oxidoreductase [Pseudonocardia sp. S2-4]|uniref:SDR family oxidoreductase n=2 Tax=Pseudonocardia humida TaxID=2800819 RepID=A0ABT1AC50_9PSEU|nr:SDR family oxidoreductase [Pseudonocardia humida]